jgi:hypothetical protein
MNANSNDQKDQDGTIGKNKIFLLHHQDANYRA